MKTVIAAVTALVLATPAAAGYRYVTVDGPSSPALLGTLVSSINDAGVATGYYVDADGMGGPGYYTGFTVNADGSGFTSFSRPGYAQTGASGINNAGDITGVSVTAMGVGNGFVRSGANGSYADIVPTFAGAYYSEAIGINNSGAVTGYYVTDPAATVATLADYARGYIEIGGVFTAVDVDPSIGFGTQVTAINDAGLFTGSYLDNSVDHFSHPFVGMVDPTAPDGYDLTAEMVDPFGAPSASIGNITDNFLTTYDSLYPTPLSPTGFASAAYVLDLAHGEIDPVAVPRAYFTDIFGINASRDITGVYADPTGLHGFIGSFVPEPATWMLMVAGFGGVGATLRRRATRTARG